MDKPTIYQFRVNGYLDGTVAGWFEDLEAPTWRMVKGLYGPVVDQAALQGIFEALQ